MTCFGWVDPLVLYTTTFCVVTIDGCWIGQIYWTHSTRLHFTIHYLVSSHVFISHRFVAASNGGLPLPLGSQTVPGLSYQLLTATAHNNWTPEVISLTRQQTHSTQLTLTSCPDYNILAWTTQRTPFHYCCATAAMETCLFATPLLSNGSTCHNTISRVAHILLVVNICSLRWSCIFWMSMWIYSTERYSLHFTHVHCSTVLTGAGWPSVHGRHVFIESGVGFGFTVILTGNSPFCNAYEEFLHI
jgi:hypothetical protein